MPPTEQPPDALEKANQLARQSKFNAAFSEFELAIRRNYGNAQIHADFGAALLNAGRFPEALTQFRKAVEIDPAGLFFVERLVKALAHDVRQDQDVADFKKTVDKADRADLFHNWAQVLTQLQRSDQAIEAFTLALKKTPEIKLNIASVVQAFKNSNSTEQQIKKFQEDVDKLNDGHARNTWGEILFGLTRYAAAAEQFEKSAKVRTDWDEPYINHGKTLIELADHKKAIELLRKALKCNERAVDAYLYLGKALDQIAEYQKAVGNYQVAAVKAPSEVYFGPWLDVLKKLPNPDRAITIYRKALGKSSSIWSAELGEFLKQRGRLRESAIQFARSFPFPKAQLQETLSDLQDPKRTLNKIQKIVDQRNNPRLYINGGQMLAHINQVDRARVQLSRIAPNIPKILSPRRLLEELKHFVLAFKSTGDRSIAQEQIEQALSQQNNGAPKVQWAGVLVNDLNNYEQGLRLFQEVLITAPTSNRLAEAFANALQTAPNQSSSIENIQAAVDNAKDAAVFYQWALILIKLGQEKSAIHALQKAVKLKQDHTDAHYQLAQIFSRRGDYKKARNEFQKADPNDSSPEMLQDWGSTLLKDGRREEAIQKYLQAFRQGGDLLRIRERLNWDDELVVRFQNVVDEVHTAEAHHHWGVLLRGIKRYELAIEQFKQAISLDPDMWDSHLEWLKALGALGLSAKRLDDYEQSLIKYHDNAEAFRSLGHALFNLKQNDLAIQKLQRALERDPKHAQARSLLINCWLIANDSEKARKEAHRLLVDEPNHGYAYYCLSWCGFVEGDYEESVKQAELGIEKRADDLELQNRAAWGWYKLGREDLARKKLEEALNRDASADTYYYQGALLMDMYRYEEATAAFQKVLDLNPDDIYATHNLAAIPYNQGRYEEASKKLRRAIEVYKKQKPFLDRAIDDGSVNTDEAFYHATLLMITQSNKHDEAANILKNGLEFDQNNPSILRALSELYREQKEELLDSVSNPEKSKCYWQAMEYFQRAEKLLKELLERSSNYYFLLDLGELYLGHEDYDKARSCFEQARAKDDKSVTPYAKLGVIHLRERQPDKAIPLLQDALKLNPDDLEVKSSLAEAYLRAEKLDDAEATYRQVLNIAPNHVQSYIGLGEVCIAMGAKDSDRYSEGIEHFSRALDVGENERIRSKYLKKHEKSAVYYQRGYARVQVYEGLGSRKDTKLLEAAQKDFDSCIQLNPLHQKAKRAKEKVDKRLAYFSRDRLTETIGPRTIYCMSITVFVVVQLAFFLMPFFNRPSLIVSDKTLEAASAHASPEELQGLRSLKNSEFSNRDELSNTVKPLLKTNAEKVTAAVLENAERVKPIENFPELAGGYYALLTFGSLLFMVVGLYLPQILKLRVAGIELEKSSVDQASTGGTLGISK